MKDKNNRRNKRTSKWFEPVISYDWLCSRLVYRVEKSQVLLTEDALKISYNVLLLNLHYFLIKNQTLVEQHYYSIP